MAPNLNDALVQFRQAAAARGVILPADILDDGEIHRCDTTGRHGEGDGAYLLHTDGSVPAGGFQNWQDGIGWQDWRADIGRAPTPKENAELKRKAEADRAKREAERGARAAEAATRAVSIWEAAERDPQHPYLARKGIAAHGTRREDRTNNLIVPLYNEAGALCNLQRIDPDGNKRFLYGGRITGCFFPIGTLVDGETILIFEGFATGATGHEATGYSVAVAIVAGNLLPVAKALRAKYPNSPLVLGADDDAATALKTGHNTGIEKATEAAKAVGGWLTIPNFGPDRTDDQTDFNDLAAAAGLDAARVQIWAAKRASVSRTYEPAAALGIAAARVELAGEMSGFAKDAVDWCNRSFMDLNRAPIRCVIAPPGLGKTDAALKIVVPAVLQAGLNIVIAIPRHELGDQIVADLAALGIKARTYRSRGADDPEADTTMCRETERTGAIDGALGDVSKLACKNAKGICDYHDVCGYQRQKKDPPEVWIVAHECMTHPWPPFIPKPDVIVIDEAFYDAGEEKDVSLDLRTLVYCERYDLKVFPPPAKGEPNLEYQELLSIAERAFAVLSKLRAPCRLRPDMFPTITADDARHAYNLEWKRKLVIDDVVPGMPREDAIARAKKRLLHNQEVKILAKFWEFLAITLEDGHDESLYLQFSPYCSFPYTDETGPGVVISSRRDLHEFIADLPVLHLDGTMREPIVRQSFPHATFHKIEVGMPPMTTVSFLQITDRVFGKRHQSDLLIEEYRRLIEVVASDAPEQVGVICLKDVEDKLLTEGRAMPHNVMLAHYGNITGLNAFNDVSDLILIGRPEPSPITVEQQGRLLFKRPVIEVARFPELNGYYRRAPRGIAIRGRDEAVGVMGSLHPDEGVEALRWLACEAELLQAIYRARPLNRTPRDPLNVHIATNVCLPIEIDEVMTWDAMLPILPQVMLAQGGVWLQSYPDMRVGHPDLFSSENAARTAMQHDRERWRKRGLDSLLVYLQGIETPFGARYFLARAAGSYRELRPLSQVRYRRAGSRGRAPWAMCDLERVPDLAEWFRERGCEVTILPDIED